VPALEVRDLTSGYGEQQVLWGVSLALEPGKLTSLVGSNGAGKTTLLYTIVGALRAWSGQVLSDGREITSVPAFRRPELGMVLVPEGRQLFSSMSVEENLEMGATNSRARGRIPENLDRVFEMFPRLKERRGQAAGTLSGGEQQMLAVARGIMAQPAILMIDELSLGLAPLLAVNLFEKLLDLKDTGLTMLLVEQNVQLALKISDYAYVLREGEIFIHGPAAEVAANPEVRTAYLGV
jgi:branched-chain amino acid transport system ATP-binding protein